MTAPDKVLTLPVEEKGTWTDSDPTTTHPMDARSAQAPYKVYQAELKGGAIYPVSLMCMDPGKSPYAFLIVEDQNGRKVTSNQDSEGRPKYQTTFSVPADGPYRLVVVSMQGPGNFTLTIKPGYLAPSVPAEKDIVINPQTRFGMAVANPGAFEAKIDALFLSADGSRVAVMNGPAKSPANVKQKTQIWDITGEPQKLCEYDGVLLAFSPDGKRLARMGKGGIGTMDVDNGKDLGVIGLINNVTFPSPDVVVGMSMNPLEVTEYDAASGKRLGSFKNSDDRMIHITPPIKEGKELIVGVRDGGMSMIKVWDLSSQKLVRKVPLPDAKTSDNWSGYTVSPDGKWIAMKLGNDPSRIFDATTGAVAATLPPDMGRYASAFLPNRDIFLTPSSIARQDKQSLDLVAYDINKQSVIAAFRGHEKGGFKVAVSANGKVLAVGNEEGNVLIWDLTQLK